MPRSSRETCRCCWQPSPVSFFVSDEVWVAAVQPEFRHTVLCIGCFARFADERLVEWDREIEFFPVSAASMQNEVVANGAAP